MCVLQPQCESDGDLGLISVCFLSTDIGFGRILCAWLHPGQLLSAAGETALFIESNIASRLRMPCSYEPERRCAAPNLPRRAADNSIPREGAERKDLGSTILTTNSI